jgi:uncharacterized membrane protein YdjX (TVP38/TMEM64 family)
MPPQTTSLSPPVDDRPGGGRRGVLRVVLLGVVLAGALAGVYFSPLRPWLADTERVRRAIGSMGVWAYPACVVLVAVLVACGTPRLLFAAIGPMVLGFWWGLALTQLGALLGYYAVFLFVRWGGREWVMHRWPRLGRWGELLRDQGVGGVILIRQIPMHGTLINLCLGLSGVTHAQFLVGSAIGILPEAIPVSLVGAGLVRGSVRESLPYLVAGVIAFVVLWIACARGLRTLRKTRGGAELISEVTSSQGASN